MSSSSHLSTASRPSLLTRRKPECSGIQPALLQAPTRSSPRPSSSSSILPPSRLPPPAPPLLRSLDLATEYPDNRGPARQGLGPSISRGRTRPPSRGAQWANDGRAEVTSTSARASMKGEACNGEALAHAPVPIHRHLRGGGPHLSGRRS